MKKSNIYIKRAVFKTLLILFLINGTVLQIHAQHKSRTILTGNVSDAKTGEPLIGVNILIKGTVYGTSTDENGKFKIDYLPAGTYDVEATMIGYKSQLKKGIRIRIGMVSRIEFKLQPTVLQLPALTITASKSRRLIKDTPATIDVISTKAIQSRSAMSLEEIIQNTAGIGINKGQIDLRGSTGFNWAAGSRVLLMVDGHPHISAETGGINWDSLPLEEVERIEIVKGAGSAIYGSNAMAGMINIITRDPSKNPETRIKLMWGFYDEPSYPQWRWTDRFLTYRLRELHKFDPISALSFGGIDLSHSRYIGSVGFLVTAGLKKSTGYTQNGQYIRWNITGKAKIPLPQSIKWTLSGKLTRNDRGDFLQWLSQSQPMKVPEEAIGDWVRSDKMNIHSTFKKAVNKNLAFTAKQNWYRIYWKNHFHDNKDYTIADRLGTELQADYFLGSNSLTFGTEITYHRAESMMYGNRHIYDFAIYVEDEVRFSPKWIMTLGTRYDHHTIKNISTDHQISPRIGLVFHPQEKSSIRLSAGHGFRAPSIAEVFANTTVSGFRVIPNLKLNKAERAWSFELGFRQSLALRVLPSKNFNPALMLDMALFYSRYRDMIDVDINLEEMAFQFKNLNKARNMGFEIRLTAAFFNRLLSTNIGYTYIDPINLETGKMLNYRSRHRFVSGAVLNIWRLTIGLDYRYASRIEEVVIYPSDERVPMHVVDGRIILDLQPVTISIEAKNLRNYNYTLRPRYLEPIRHFIITIRGKF